VLDRYFHGPGLHLAERRRKCDLRRVAADTDAYEAVEVGLSRGVEKPPSSRQEALEDGMEIAGLQAIGVAADKSGRDVESAAERDTEMGKVSTHPCPLQEALCGSGLFV
jgi:hypothetical protein